MSFVIGIFFVKLIQLVLVVAPHPVLHHLDLHLDLHHLDLHLLVLLLVYPVLALPLHFLLVAPAQLVKFVNMVLVFVVVFLQAALLQVVLPLPVPPLLVLPADLLQVVPPVVKPARTV